MEKKKNILDCYQNGNRGSNLPMVTLVSMTADRRFLSLWIDFLCFSVGSTELEVNGNLSNTTQPT